ncbi:MAG: hypothetical protein KGL61_01345, partial [Burkholderiales bacterium]|nr:hypothetical protein [Burkholderiales bacterium]
MSPLRRFSLACLLPVLLGASALSVGTAGAAEPIKAGTITNSPPMVSYASDGTTLQGVIVDLA